jgi:hypothetical protein
MAVSGPIQIGPSGMSLLKPSVLGFVYDPAVLSSEDEMHLGVFKKTSSGWEYLPARIDRSNHIVNADIGAFGVYALVWSLDNPSLKEMPSITGGASIWPNPFAGTVSIKYQVAKSGNVDISIYNILGQKMREIFKGYQAAGQHEFSWDGRNTKGVKAAPGVYYYRVSGNSISQTGRMVMVK